MHLNLALELADVLELADIMRETWPAISADLHASGVPLNEGEDPADPAPAPGEATIQWDSDDNPYKARFETYRSEADRRNNEFSQVRSHLNDLRSEDPERRRAAAQALDLDLVEDDDDPGYADPYDELRAELDALKSARAQEAEQRQRDLAMREIDRRLDALKLTDDGERDLVFRFALGMPGEDGLPDIDAAFKVLSQRDEARVQAAMREWGNSKRTARIAPGSTATERPDVLKMTDAEMVDYAVQLLHDRE